MWNKEGTEPISPPLPVEERRVVAWAGTSVIFKGTLISSEDMMIDGHVQGTIEIRDHGLTVGPEAEIRAEVVAATVTIHGTVIGNVRASERIDVRASAHVEGNVIAPRVGIADGAVVCGKVDTSGEQSGGATKLRGHSRSSGRISAADHPRLAASQD